MLKHSLFISLAVERYEKKKERDIIVILLGVCYNLNIIDGGKPIFWRISLLWKQSYMRVFPIRQKKSDRKYL